MYSGRREAQWRKHDLIPATDISIPPIPFTDPTPILPRRKKRKEDTKRKKEWAEMHFIYFKGLVLHCKHAHNL